MLGRQVQSHKVSENGTPSDPTLLGRTLRATLYRPERICRVPFGIGKGIKLAVDADAPLHKYIGTAEMELSRYIREFAKLGSVCFDVGAYDAHMALVLALHTKAPVWSFEFRDERVARMHRNLELNPDLADKVQVMHTYVSNETLESPKVDSIDNLIETEQVEAPDFLKIDVEGAEIYVLNGATRLLRERKPHILLETHSDQLATECLTLLACVGYQPGPMRKVPQRKWLTEHRGREPNEWIAARGGRQ